ncbi:hypothetical protein GFV12_02535 [Desulfurobacterium thermolithotrophum]|uniref:hypothetical protein n=1 Tax=Desulfurobacterium thermolithotrophum TaxID=64160 RepID=UPI0013D2CD7B|nr:hypothetical protein [Desulfurobacterium thermolithotrophum]
MTVSEISLVVIAICMVFISLSVVGIAIAMYRLLKKFEESVDTVNNQLRPAVIELKKTVSNLTQAFQMVNDTVSFIRKFRKKEKK